MSDKQIKLLPSQSRMALSTKTVVVLIGPKGEGKTCGAVAAIMKHAQRFPYKIRGAVIRDRFTNIQRHTIPSIMKASGGVITFHRDGALMKGPNFEADLFGVDDLGDISNIQGSEYYFVWIEEPAPVFDVGSAGIREDVFTMCYARGGREAGAIDKVFVTMNPASKGHWTYKKFVLNPHVDFYDDKTGELDIEVIRIPYGENTFLPDKERAKTMRAFKNRPELYARYVRGEFSNVNLGMSVTPEFSELFHRSPIIIEPWETLTFRLWDGGLWPTCVFLQIFPNGQIVCLKTVRGENIGMRQLIEYFIKPLLATTFRNIREWRDIGDPSLWNRDPMDSTKSVAEVIETELNTVYEPGEMGWENRREALQSLFTRVVDGQPGFLISADDDVMIEALGGGWHYHKNAAGQILKDLPVKDQHSHPGDALSHGIAAIMNPTVAKPNRPEKCVTDFNIFDEPKKYGSGGIDFGGVTVPDWNPFQS
jgi:hypothetical protein